MLFLVVMAGKNTCHVNCSVFGCKSIYFTLSDISFHNFPKENESKVMWTNKLGVSELVDRRRMWAINLRMGKETSKKKTQNLL